jgi:hypothetical protein
MASPMIAMGTRAANEEYRICILQLNTIKHLQDEDTPQNTETKNRLFLLYYTLALCELAPTLQSRQPLAHLPNSTAMRHKRCHQATKICYALPRTYPAEASA